jgi:hypothetical protein
MVRRSARADENVGGALRAPMVVADAAASVAAGTAPPTFAELRFTDHRRVEVFAKLRRRSDSVRAPGRAIENRWRGFQAAHRSVLTD